MSTQQDIYAAGSENRPPMLNKENYVPWSSRLLRYAKSRPNGKLIYNSIMNGPYVRRMIPEPGDTDREICSTGMNMVKDRRCRWLELMVGNQFRQYAGQNVGINMVNIMQVQISESERARGNAPGNNCNQIRTQMIDCQKEEAGEIQLPSGTCIDIGYQTDNAPSMIQRSAEKQPNLFEGFKSLAKKADESLVSTRLEVEIERLLRAVVRVDNMLDQNGHSLGANTKNGIDLAALLSDRNSGFVRNSDVLICLQGKRFNNFTPSISIEMAFCIPNLPHGLSDIFYKSLVMACNVYPTHFDTINDCQNDLVSGPFPKFKYQKRAPLCHLMLSPLSRMIVVEDIGKLGAKGLILLMLRQPINNQNQLKVILDFLFEVGLADLIGGQTSPAQELLRLLNAPSSSSGLPTATYTTARLITDTNN
ncbi:hypothetical protein Tco_0098440 [Tanacetum coccineum]